jgi:hypothetical protein
VESPDSHRLTKLKFISSYQQQQQQQQQQQNKARASLAFQTTHNMRARTQPRRAIAVSPAFQPL